VRNDSVPVVPDSNEDTLDSLLRLVVVLMREGLRVVVEVVAVLGPEYIGAN
jgi:hypothetical protein